MKTLLAVFLALWTAAEAAKPPIRRMPLRHDPACVLAAVAWAMNVPLDPAKPKPAIRLETQTPLKEFQDAVEPQWGSRPDVFTNAYSPTADKIFLIEDAGYYERMHRDIADSLAHEYVHYIQVKYRGIGTGDFGDAEESEAVSWQTWFRDNYIRGTAPAGAPACAPR
jgi:hypothetical protein